MLDSAERRTATTKTVRETEAEAIAFYPCSALGSRDATPKLKPRLESANRRWAVAESSADLRAMPRNARILVNGCSGRVLDLHLARLMLISINAHGPSQFQDRREEDDSIACRWRVDQVRHGDRAVLSERLHRRSVDNHPTVIRPTRHHRGRCFCGEARNRSFPGSGAIDIELPFSFIKTDLCPMLIVIIDPHSKALLRLG